MLINMSGKAIKADKSTKTRKCLPNSGNAAILGACSVKSYLASKLYPVGWDWFWCTLLIRGFYDKVTTTSLPELRQNIKSDHWRFSLSLNSYIITSDWLVQLFFFQFPHSHYSIFLDVTAYLLYMLHLQLHKWQNVYYSCGIGNL